MENDITNSLTTGDDNKECAETAAVLMDMAYSHFSPHLLGTTDSTKIHEYFKRLWLMNNNRLSRKYSYLYHQDNKPVALLSSYPGEFTEKMFFPSLWEVIKVHHGMFAYVLGHLNYLAVILRSPEALKDEYYISMLAVLPEYQNKGIGSGLLKFAEKKARELGFKKLSLVVLMDNTNAIKLYENFGFQKVLTYDREPMNVYKMVKNLA